jgi:hypothetical protein
MLFEAGGSGNKVGENIIAATKLEKNIAATFRKPHHQLGFLTG